MADSDADNKIPELPPKLSLPKAGKPAAKGKDSGQSDKKRPSIKMGNEQKTEKQGRPAIKLKSEEAFEDESSTTMHIDLSSALSDELSEKSKSDLAAEASTTMHIDISETSEAAPDKTEDAGSGDSSTTMHMDLSDLQEEAAEARKAADNNEGSSTTMHMDLSDLQDEAAEARSQKGGPKTIPLTKRRKRSPDAKKPVPSKKKALENDPDDIGSTMRIDLMANDEGGDEQKNKTVKSRPVKTEGGPKTVKAKPRPTLKRKDGDVSEKSSGTVEIDLTKTDAADAAPKAGPRTIKVKPKSPADAKSETSRINLEDAMATTDAADGKAPVGKQTDGPKTIRIKPSGRGKTVKRKREDDSKKSETSRISLEDALASDSEHDGPAAVGKQTQGPKTIRLKRPSEAATIKAKGRPTSTQEAPEATFDSEDVTATRRKTIRLKRPGQSESGGLKVARSADSEEEDAPALVLDEEEAVQIDQPGPFFAILAMFIVVACGVVAWMFATQVFPEQQHNLEWFQQHAEPGPF